MTTTTTTESSTIRVAAVQAEPVWLDLQGSVDEAIALIEEAAAGGAQLVGFPETFIPGYPVFLWSYPAFEQPPYQARYFANSLEVDSPEYERLRTAARDNDIVVVIGFSERDHGSLYMAQSIIGADGEVVLHRRKLKPTHVERTLFGESDGSGIRAVDTPLGRVGALNCFEHIQPLTKYAMYAQHEQIHVAAWPCLGILGNVPQVSPESLIAATQTYALEGGAFVLMATQIMSDEGAKCFPDANGGPTPVHTGGGGYARVYGPFSELRTEPLPDTQEGIVYADIDLADIGSAKNAIDPVGHYSRPDVTALLFNPNPQRRVAPPARPAVRADDADEAVESGDDFFSVHVEPADADGQERGDTESVHA